MLGGRLRIGGGGLGGFVGLLGEVEDAAELKLNGSQALTTTQMADNYSKAFHLVWFTVFIIYGVAMVILNFLTAVTITINRHLRKRSLFCVVNLAIADMVFGLVAIPCFLVEYSGGYLKWQARLLQSRSFLKGGEIFPSIASISFLVLICLERCYATFYPFHSRLTSFKTYVVGVVITWLLAVVASVLYILFQLLYFLQLIWVIASTCVICLGYLAIYFKLKLQNRQMQQMAARATTQRERELAKTLFIYCRHFIHLMLDPIRGY
ncbi:hypothetical protein QZH41_009038 [Actinostola sp. cb2023]|nr:hypothetical protein QZH41_009038 [Actinostola sp. cb2023]